MTARPTDREMLEPTFLGIGAQKCASTWVYEILRDHPQVVVSEVKEVDFFSYHYDHGLQWYQSHFRDKSGARAVGEISPSYFYEPSVPARVKHHFPNVKLLVSLRDPLARAISNHKHEVRVGHLRGTDLSFEAGLKNNPTYIDQGLYATHLSRWLEFFPMSQILVILFDDIDANGADVAKCIYEFLNVDQNHKPAALKKKSNPGHIVRYQSLESFRTHIHALSRRAGLSWLLRVASHLGSRRLYDMINRAPSESVMPPISEETLSRLRAIYHDEITGLERLLDRSLERWRC